MSDEAATPTQAAAVIVAPPRFLSWLGRRPYAVLALLCLILWLPGILSLPALDRDESRFAESSRQMLESGNFVDIRFGQVPRYKKPVGIYWAQALTTALAGRVYGMAGSTEHIWTYRLPSLLGGIAAAWLTCWCGALFGAEVGLLAGLLMGGSILLTAEATIATTDAVLLASIVAMQGVLLRFYQAPGSTKLVLAGWAALAIGILVKGPVAPGVAAATIVALCGWNWWERRSGREAQDWRWLKNTRPLLGVPLALLIVLPWLIAIGLESHGAFFQQSLGNDFADKLAGGQESHGALPGYYLLLAAITFWPAILFILPGIGLGIARRAEPAIRFLLAWAGGWWLVVEIVPTKLPQYVLPAYPALAILASLWLLAPADKTEGWRRWLPRIAVIQFLVGLGALTWAPAWLPRFYGAGDVWWLTAGAGVVLLIGLVALWLFLKAKPLTALGPVLAASLIAVPLLTVGMAPQLTQLWVSQSLAALVLRDTQTGDPPPVLAGYTEPSLVFALGADVGLTDGRGAADWGAKRGGLALVEDRERPAFLAHLAELQADAAAKDELSGFNYSRGRRVHVTVYRVTGLHDQPAPFVP
jgi:4-amino-4-deoxy-L-arabinose transferase-like glycosyltransferase